MVIPAFSLLRRFEDGGGYPNTYLIPIHPQAVAVLSLGGVGCCSTHSRVTASASAGDPVNLRLFPLGGVVYHLKDKKGSEGFLWLPVTFFGAVVGDGNKKRSPVLCLKEAEEPLWKDG